MCFVSNQVLKLIKNIIFLSVKTECISKDVEGVKSQDVEIKFSKSDCSVSCQMNMFESKTIYWTKLLKQTNDGFNDIVHKRLKDQKYVIHWFNCTDAKLRFTVNESNLEEPSLNMFLNNVRDSDSGTYTCVINSGNIYWNKATINFAGITSI